MLFYNSICYFLIRADYEQREYEAVKRVRDSIQLVENAMLERDQVNPPIHKQSV